MRMFKKRESKFLSLLNDEGKTSSGYLRVIYNILQSLLFSQDVNREILGQVILPFS